MLGHDYCSALDLSILWFLLHNLVKRNTMFIFYLSLSQIVSWSFALFLWKTQFRNPQVPLQTYLLTAMSESGLEPLCHVTSPLYTILSLFIVNCLIEQNLNKNNLFKRHVSQNARGIPGAWKLLWEDIFENLLCFSFLFWTVKIQITTFLKTDNKIEYIDKM